MLRRVAMAASFRHATWGPDELFYGELYSSRRVDCKPTLARPGTRDEYSACVGRELVENDLYDFLLFSLPDNDYHSHRYGPEAQPAAISRADAALGELVDAAGGLEAFLADHAVIVVADHAQTDVEHPLALAEELARDWAVLGPNERPRERRARGQPDRPRAAPFTCSTRGSRAPGSTPAFASGSRSSRASTCSRGWPPPMARRSPATAASPTAAGRWSSATAPGFRSPRAERARPARRALGPRRRPGRGRGEPWTARASTALPIPDALVAALGGAARSARRRHPDLGSRGLRAGRLGRHDPLSGWQPRRARGGRLARSAAALRTRGRGRADPRAMDAARRRGSRPRPLRGRARRTDRRRRSPWRAGRAG